MELKPSAKKSLWLSSLQLASIMIGIAMEGYAVFNMVIITIVTVAFYRTKEELRGHFGGTVLWMFVVHVVDSLILFVTSTFLLFGISFRNMKAIGYGVVGFALYLAYTTFAICIYIAHDYYSYTYHVTHILVVSYVILVLKSYYMNITNPRDYEKNIEYIK